MDEIPGFPDTMWPYPEDRPPSKRPPDCDPYDGPEQFSPGGQA